MKHGSNRYPRRSCNQAKHVAMGVKGTGESRVKKEVNGPGKATSKKKAAKKTPVRKRTPEENEAGADSPQNGKVANRSERGPERFVTVRSTPHNPQGEWMVDAFFLPADKSKLIAETIEALGFDKGCSILIPGVGKSHLARDLTTAGFKNVAAADVDDPALDYQSSLVSDVVSFEIHKMNLLQQSTLPSETYDVVVDCSVSDVFLEGGGIRAVQQHLRQMLSDKGALITMSMNHKEWPSLLKGYESFYYSAIEQWSGSSRNPKNLQRDVAFLVAVNGMEISESQLPSHKLMASQNKDAEWLRNPRADQLAYTAVRHCV